LLAGAVAAASSGLVVVVPVRYFLVILIRFPLEQLIQFKLVEVVLVAQRDCSEPEMELNLFLEPGGQAAAAADPEAVTETAIRPMAPREDLAVERPKKVLALEILRRVVDHFLKLITQALKNLATGAETMFQTPHRQAQVAVALEVREEM
jgi:hypothetical protein